MLAATLALACAGDAPPSGGGVVAPVASTGATETPGARIGATLYYASADGAWLVPVLREVPFAEGVLAQGRQILDAQLGEAPENLRHVFPEGTRLRGFYVTDRGEAFVDLSVEVAALHPGGALTEQLTVFAIVNAVTTNLPAVERVQILIGGREVDTLAGHLDLRRPLEADRSLVRE
jgi:hypothetical protein